MKLRAELAAFGAVSWKEWGKVAATLLVFIAFTVGLTILFHRISDRIQFSIYESAWIAYLVVFTATLVSNLSLVTPAPVALAVMLPAATLWNPALIGLAAGLGASIGELSGYLAGYLGRKMILPETFMCRINDRFCISHMGQKIQQYGAWAIGVLAFQPILPFDVGGILAGMAKMRLPRFFLALLAGKTAKFVALAYLSGLIAHLPFLSSFMLK
ncbi:MAG: VTT domain-containing protein [Dehalococcoidales bacterium]|nr:VTT domain-containing protein [Dehalococcoidales bacterium]